MSIRTGEPPFPWVGLVTLTLAIFVSVTTEFLPTGLLPYMARDLGVSQSAIGLLVTVFAGTVVLATTPLAVLTRNYSRKTLVVVVLLVIAFGAVLAAVAPSYEILLGARIIGGLAHGLFWAVVGAYAAHLVPKQQLGKAMAVTAAGGTASFVLGVPLGSAVGHALGWRLAFVFMAVLIVVLCGVVLRFLPPVDHRVTLATGEIPLPMRKDRTLVPVALSVIIIVVLMGGQNLFYTYIAPYLIDVAGFDETAIPVLLLLFGGAGAIGLVLAGLVSDRFPRGGLVAAFVIVALSIAALALWPGQPVVVVVAIVAWGVSFGGCPAMLQSRTFRGASPRMRNLAAALQTTGFNIAIGGGALLGGILLDAYGLSVLPLVDIAVIVVGLLLVLAADRWLAARARRFAAA